MAQERATPTPPQPGASTPAWETWVNRTAAILAVLAALSSGQWGASNLRAILEQGKVNDGWAYFQAKSIKGHMAEQTQRLAESLAEDVVPEKRGKLAAYAAAMAAETQRYDREKNAQKAAVEGLEQSRDECVERSFWFEIAFVCLQVGVVLSTIAAAAKRRGFWIAAILFGLLGLVFVANGTAHFLRAPPDLSKKLGPKLDVKIAEPPPPAGGGAEGGAAPGK